MSTRDRVTVVLMVLIPTSVVATLVWLPAMATIVFSFFDWDGKDGFFLQTYSQYLAFTAARISVSVTATQRP